MSTLISPELLSSAYDYGSYRQLIDRLLAQGKTTGPYDSKSMLDYTLLNQKRMDKWEKIGKVLPALQELMKNISQPMIWLVLTEGWCGDAAQCLPFIYKMGRLNPLIDLKLILRDQNLDLMDAYRTDGGRSIPKLIALSQQLDELGTWGPRPRPMQNLMLENKKSSAQTYDELAKEMHLWYSKDRGVTLQKEFLELIPEWNKLML
ncbi:MAG: thioredoxin family protein [Cyclobacteriaceae bacterium]|nr:thioredoxin family protein [Cyclobacteriaceae bacterium]